MSAALFDIYNDAVSYLETGENSYSSANSIINEAQSVLSKFYGVDKRLDWLNEKLVNYINMWEDIDADELIENISGVIGEYLDS